MEFVLHVEQQFGHAKRINAQCFKFRVQCHQIGVKLVVLDQERAKVFKNSSKFIIAAAAVFAAATSAYAQGTATEIRPDQGITPQSQQQTQEQMQQQANQPYQGSTTQPATGSSMNRTDGTGAAGMGTRTDSTAADGRTPTTERVARADRN